MAGDRIIVNEETIKTSFRLRAEENLVPMLIESGGGKPETADKADDAAEALASEAMSAAPAPAVSGASRIPEALWQDPDVRWLTGYNEAEGHAYINREQYEELLWWLALPELLRVANMAAPTRSAASAVKRSIDDAVKALEKVHYRLDLLLHPQPPDPDPDKEPAPSPDATEMITTAIGSKPGINAPLPEPEDLEPQEPVNVRPAGPSTDPDGPPEDY